MAGTGIRVHCRLHCLMLSGAVWLREQRELHSFLLERTGAVQNKDVPNKATTLLRLLYIMLQA